MYKLYAFPEGNTRKKKGKNSEQEWLWIKTVKRVKREKFERRRENRLK